MLAIALANRKIDFGNSIILIQHLPFAESGGSENIEENVVNIIQRNERFIESFILHHTIKSKVSRLNDQRFQFLGDRVLTEKIFKFFYH